MRNTLLKNLLVFIISSIILAGVIVFGILFSDKIAYSDANKAKNSIVVEQCSVCTDYIATCTTII